MYVLQISQAIVCARLKVVLQLKTGLAFLRKISPDCLRLLRRIRSHANRWVIFLGIELSGLGFVPVMERGQDLQFLLQAGQLLGVGRGLPVYRTLTSHFGLGGRSFLS